MNKIILLTLIGLLLSGAGRAQDPEVISVPLSSPGETGILKIHNHNGTIEIVGHNGSTVEIEIVGEEDKDKDDRPKRRGLKRIPNKSMGVSITEEDNYVHINASNNSRKDYFIKVPTRFSLNVSSHHNGEITIRNVIGELEINSHHGGIQMENVGGAVIADTHHGSIEVSLQEITNGVPMAFTTYHGDVDISFPSNLNADVKMKSAKGDIYTDFDFAMTKPKLEESKKGKRKQIKVSGWTYGSIGGGGAELMFDTYHGDVILRKTN